MGTITEGLPAGGLGGGAGLLNVVEDLTPQLGGNLDLNGNVITGLEIGTDIQAWSAILDATTASFVIADETKLDGIEALAEVNVVDSVFTRTGDVVAAASDYDASQVDNDSDVEGAFVDDALDRLNSIPWDLSGLIVTGSVFDTSSQSLTPGGMFIRDDGLKMFVIDFTSKTVYQYTLSISWDISSALFDSKSFVATQVIFGQGVWFSPDGLKMFVVSGGTIGIFEYDLGTPWDISTAVYNSITLSFGAEIVGARDVFFRADGLKMYIPDDKAADITTVEQYSLTIAYDLSTATYDSISFDVSSQMAEISDVFFKDDGLKMFILDNSSGEIFQYILSTAWDVGTASFDNVTIDVATVSSILSLFFKKHGATLYISNDTSNEIQSFEIAKQDDNPYTDIEKTELGRLSSDLLLNEQSSGILSGGILSINGGDNTKFDFTAGLLYIVDSFTDPEQPKITSVEFTAQTAITATEVVTDNETFVGIRLDNVAPTGGTATALAATVDGVPGTVYITQKPSVEYTREETRDIVQIGAMLHSGVVIGEVFNLQQLDNSVSLRLSDLAFAIGIINISGNEFSANGANLNIDKTVGDIFRQGSNNDGTAAGLKNPDISTVASDTAVTFRYRHQDGSGSFTILSDTTVIDPDQFDDGSGTLVAVGNNKHTIKKLYVGPTGLIRLEYGQVIYNSQSEAEEAVATATITDPILTAEAAFRGWLIVKKGATDLTVSGDAKFIGAGKFNITTAGSMSGEINTASDVGVGGISVFKQKTGVNLEFNSIAAESSKIVVTLNAGQNEVRIDAVPANFDTSALNNDANFADDQTGAEIKTAYEAEANAYTDTKDTKLSGIEAGAEVNDPVPIILAVSDETTDLAIGNAKLTFRMPYAFTLTAVRASVSTAPTGSAITVDINEGGTTILSTKLTIDATEKTSTTAAVAAVISDADLADDAEMTIDIDVVGSTIAGAGLKVTLIGDPV